MLSEELTFPMAYVIWKGPSLAYFTRIIICNAQINIGYSNQRVSK